MYEIEVKAWLDNKRKAEEALSLFAEYRGITQKKDVYWQQQSVQKETQPTTIGKIITEPKADKQEHEPQEVRIRSQVFTPSATALAEDKAAVQTETIITYKHKNIKNGFELNEEIEFSVSDATAFEAFLRGLGFAVKSKKQKTTDNWYAGKYHIELADVEHIGLFIEIETLSPTADATTTAQCHTELVNLLSRCGVPESAIEARYYTQMLAEGINSTNRK